MSEDQKDIAKVVAVLIAACLVALALCTVVNKTTDVPCSFTWID